MRGIVLPSLLSGALCLSACGHGKGGQRKPEAPTGGSAASNDPELTKKLAEAKAAYDGMTPADRKLLAEQQKRIANTLPLPLAEAGAIKVEPQGGAAITLGTLAPAGKPTLIAVWASWCFPCIAEARELAALRQRYGPDQLNIVYLNIGDPKVEAVKGPAFLKEAGAQRFGLTMLAPDNLQRLTRVDK